jgi:maltooligosyltrehalose trehalohydrolase
MTIPNSPSISQATANQTPATKRFIGARANTDGTYFRLWAPLAKSAVLMVENHDAPFSLIPERDGYFSAMIHHVGAGDRYKYVVNGGDPFPDPASRYQPQGPHGPSQVIDPLAFQWSEIEATWPGVSIHGQVLYELHVGTFTPEGTFLGAIAELPRLKNLGITVIECMPLAEFPGNIGWGYDGVSLFAPFHHYGTPDDLRQLVDAAHQQGLGIILDVVYNHLGPDGNYLSKYSADYFSGKDTEWGDGINFDGENSIPVREFFLANAAHWIS